MPRSLTIVGLGEALVDIFPDHQALGGAPLNVAVHAHQLLAGSGSGCGVVVSRVGRDDLGRQILADLTSRGMSVETVQLDDDHPTGQVLVTSRRSGEPVYKIVEDVAWDHLEFTDELGRLAGRCDAVCFGTLARRSPVSRATIGRFLQQAPQAVRLYDVNLRQHYYDESLIREGCELATMVKLNEAELPIILRLLGLGGVEALLGRFGLDAVVLTRGAAGTTLYTAGGAIMGEPNHFEPEPGADSVGAGDACAAGVLVMWLLGGAPEMIVWLANYLGAYVASRRGATPELPFVGGGETIVLDDRPEDFWLRPREGP